MEHIIGMRPLVKFQWLFTALFLGFLALPAAATTYYVDINSTNPTPPYTDWSTAATNIQAAIDQSTNGDSVLVNDGVYQTGGETINGFNTTNRVAINKSITVQSINGPSVTVIQGSPPQPPNGGVRCVYMTNNAALIGFTLTGGSATAYYFNLNQNDSGGGVWCEANNAVLSNCVITANFAGYDGGGVYQGTLLNCTVSQNSINPFSPSGQGGQGGGGVYQSILINCMVISNAITNLYFQASYGYGGGAYSSELTNCVVADNWIATNNGVGGSGGGGAYLGTLVNCTITGNSAWFGGGTYEANMTNCIDYYNTSQDPLSINDYGGFISYSCATPMPFGTANITNAPLLASISCISTNSPCRGAGDVAATSGVDINGNPWANPPSMGCDEPYPGNVTGTNVTVGISTPYTSYPPGYVANFQVNISGPVTASVWNFGDGTIVTNMLSITHSWPAVGPYPVTLTAYNDSYPTGVVATLTINVSTSLVYYVDLNSHYPGPPYRTWSSAAATIQDAVNAANPGSLVLVTNGTTSAPNTNLNAMYYNGGMVAPNGTFYRVAVTNPITVESVHGPGTTLIVGNIGTSAGCVYLANGASLIGFTLTNGINGGIFGSTNTVITNCVITHCSAYQGNGGIIEGLLYNCLITNTSGTYQSFVHNSTFVMSGEMNSGLDDCVLSNGGPADGGILNNCLITHNSGGVGGNGGGAYGDGAHRIVLNNCVISSNTAASGGGVYGSLSSYCVLNNCLVVSNYATQEGGGAYQAQLNNCTIISNAVRNTGGFQVGGGAALCVLTNCSLIGNLANLGGGAYAGQLTNCTLLGNTAYSMGGGAYNGFLYNCLVVSNTAGPGGGVYGGTVNQSTILDNLSLDGQGGGACNSMLYDCLISSNMALNAASSESGGGAFNSRLTNCLLTYNFSATNGGGAYQSTLVNCTVAFNSGVLGGGIVNCHADNCILYYNTGGDFSPNTSAYPLNYCCSPVLATNGFFNITGAPLFVNAAGDDFHLQSTSPCINAGNNVYVTAATDLDGNPRIQGGTVDIGAYEYQTPTSVISYAYLQQYGLPTDGSVDFVDLDGSGFNVYQDWIAGLNPTNPASVLIMLSPPATNNTSGITVTWQSVSGILYNLQRTTNLPTPFSTIQSNIVGNAGTTSYTDTSATNNIPYFYRVGVP
jgi:hypothetical protein